MGCKGPQTNYNCPSVRFNGQTSWPVKAGHGCVGCASFRFWDNKSPFYDRLPNIAGFGVDVSAGEIGAMLVTGVAAATAAHGLVSIARHKRAGGDQPPPFEDESTKPVSTGKEA
jgi:hydrogenase small subunit